MFVKTWGFASRGLDRPMWIGQVGPTTLLLLNAAEEFVCNAAGRASWGQQCCAATKFCLIGWGVPPIWSF